MTNPDQTELQKAIHEGKFSEVIDLELDTKDPSYLRLLFLKMIALIRYKRLLQTKEILEELENRYDGFEIVDKIWFLNLKSILLLNISKSDLALQLNEQVQLLINQLTRKQKDDNTILMINYKINRGRYYYSIGDYEVSKNYFIEAESLAEGTNHHPVIGEIMWRLSEVMRQTGNFMEAESLILRKIEYMANKKNKFEHTQSYIELAALELELSNFEKSLSYLKKAELINEGVGSELLEWRIKNGRAQCYQYMGKLDDAITIYKSNITLVKAFHSKISEGTVYNNLGITYYLKGELDLALQYLFKSLSIYEEFDDVLRIATSYNNIAMNYKLKGEVDKALDFLHQCLEINEKYGDSSDLATSYVNLGLLYHLKGRYSDAENFYLKCLELDRKLSHDVNTAETLYNLIILDLEMDNENRAQGFMEELENLVIKNPNPVIELRRDIARVNLLKRSNRSIQQARAQEILMKIINSGPIDYELYVEAMYLQCELLLIELRQTGEEEVITDLARILNRLQSFAEEQKSYSLLAEIYLMQSRLSLLNLDLDQSISYIEEAEYITKERGLTKLQMKISAQHDSLLDQLRTWEKFVEEDMTLSERIEKVNLEDVFLRALTSKTEESISEPEIPFMFYIIVEGGVTIYRKRFQSEFEHNEELIAGLFSAIHTLSDEVFNTTRSLQRIKHENYTILLKPLGNLLFSYIFQGQSYNAVNKIDQLIETIISSETIWKALNREVHNLTVSEKDGMDIIMNEIFLHH